MFVRVASVLIIIAAAGTLFALFVNTAGLRSNDLHRKYVFYKAATWLSLIAGTFTYKNAIPIIPMPNSIVRTERPGRLPHLLLPLHQFLWPSELGIRLVIRCCLGRLAVSYLPSFPNCQIICRFAFGALLLLICDKEHEEVYYKEKTIYNPPVEFA